MIEGAENKSSYSWKCESKKKSLRDCRCFLCFLYRIAVASDVKSDSCRKCCNMQINKTTLTAKHKYLLYSFSRKVFTQGDPDHFLCT